MKIRFWTKKANKDTNNCYCDYYLKDKGMMCLLGVETNSKIEEEILDGNFSCLIDDLGEYEELMKKYGIKDFDTLDKALSFYKTNKGD